MRTPRTVSVAFQPAIFAGLKLSLQHLQSVPQVGITKHRRLRVALDRAEKKTNLILQCCNSELPGCVNRGSHDFSPPFDAGSSIKTKKPRNHWRLDATTCGNSAISTSN